ncbi:MAG: nicotinate phosphoribosyltransferase [Candidatus Sungbacteria bacterium]|nr:nicotinate phosphoribosyltransferase [Candidatus Sungbacteria bacterium]
MSLLWQPIIQSRLDTDFYKLTMGQFVYHRYPEVRVMYEMKNRTKSVRIANFVDENDLRKELNHLQGICLTPKEYFNLRDLRFDGRRRMFQDDYLDFFRGLFLPDYRLEKEDGEYKLTFPGKWSEAIYWESPALAIVTELTYQGMMKQMSSAERSLHIATGAERMVNKLKIIQNYPGISFMEFGTRRRFSREWQDYVIASAKMLVPQHLLGTSNVWMAMKHGIKSGGTVAHETSMAFACIYHSNDDEIRASQMKMLDEWVQEYSPYLLTALTDLYGSAFFFSEFKSRAAKWQGMRQDSGDPFAFAKAAIKFFEDLWINPKTKTVLFSDGLDVDTIIKLHLAFSQSIQCAFGWGTNLTNDLDFPPISLVIKLIECCGYPAVKLSDNLAKATGPAEEIERYKKIFRHTGTLYEPCTY